VSKVHKSGTLQILQRGDAGGAPGIIPGENVIGRVMVIEKKGRLLNLNAGGTKILNRFLGLKNAYTLLQQKGKAVIRRLVGKQPGFQSLRFIYRGLKAPMRFLGGLVEKIFIGRWW
jgi:hypothetical protein